MNLQSNSTRKKYIICWQKKAFKNTLTHFNQLATPLEHLCAKSLKSLTLKFFLALYYLAQVNPLTTNDAFGRRQILATCLSVGAIRFEGKFCTSRKGGTGGGGWVHYSAWQCMVAVAAACRKALVNAGGPFVCFLAETDVENAPFTLYGLQFWNFMQLLVQRSIWSEGPDY